MQWNNGVLDVLLTAVKGQIGTNAVLMVYAGTPPDINSVLSDNYPYGHDDIQQIMGWTLNVGGGPVTHVVNHKLVPVQTLPLSAEVAREDLTNVVPTFYILFAAGDDWSSAIETGSVSGPGGGGDVEISSMAISSWQTVNLVKYERSFLAGTMTAAR